MAVNIQNLKQNEYFIEHVLYGCLCWIVEDYCNKSYYRFYNKKIPLCFDDKLKIQQSVSAAHHGGVGM